MTLRLAVDEQSNFELPAVSVLRRLAADVASRHTELGLRHPLGIYNMSITKIAHACSRVMEALPHVEIASARTPEAKEGDARLIDAYEALLHALMHHMDDCQSILRCLASTENYRKEPAVKEFEKAVCEYRDFIGILVNRVKHEQGRIRPITVRLDMFRFGGYFVESGLATGGVGPDRKIHRDGEAFSFNRDLRYHMCQLVDCIN
jgi:hypothetical protein